VQKKLELHLEPTEFLLLVQSFVVFTPMGQVTCQVTIVIQCITSILQTACMRGPIRSHPVIDLQNVGRLDYLSRKTPWSTDRSTSMQAS